MNPSPPVTRTFRPRYRSATGVSASSERGLDASAVTSENDPEHVLATAEGVSQLLAGTNGRVVRQLGGHEHRVGATLLEQVVGLGEELRVPAPERVMHGAEDVLAGLDSQTRPALPVEADRGEGPGLGHV